MKRVLILGGGGMLGHKAFQILSKSHDVYVTFRHYDERLKNTGLFDGRKVISDVVASPFESVRNVLLSIRPDVIVNCIGIIKQLNEARNPRVAIEINALFPHLLADASAEIGAKLIHISTDCVFSGSRGRYVESDDSDAHDMYGRTKFLGEVTGSNCLTLRTSIIGHELFSNRSLVDWFLSRNGTTVDGYKNAIYSGFPTIVFSREVSRIVSDFPGLTGLYQVAAPAISKYDLLALIKRVYDLRIEIIASEGFVCDRSLDGDKYCHATGFVAPTWEMMINDMYVDSKYYQQRTSL